MQVSALCVPIGVALFVLSCHTLTDRPASERPSVAIDNRDAGRRPSIAVASPVSTASLFGVWRIVSFQKPNVAVLLEANAKKQIGKSMALSASRVTSDATFLWTSVRECENVSYSWINEGEMGGHGSQALLPQGHPRKRPGNLQFLDVKCHGTTFVTFEITKGDGLVSYYDGYYFFLDRR
jgi:hypothetical protein